MKQYYDIIVIGGGHAGTEASHICSVLGASTLLITNDENKIGEMSCNPAIGGLGKGHSSKRNRCSRRTNAISI